MENNFELEEMKQQWSTLQTALNKQKEVNIRLIIKDTKKRVSWNRGFLRIVSLITLLLTVPYCLFLLSYCGVPQPICITLVSLLTAISLNALYMSFIIQTPNDDNMDILKYSKSLVKFKQHYLRTEVFGILALVAIIIWAVISMGFNIANPIVIGAIIGGVIGMITGLSLSLKMLNNVKELQSDIDFIEGLKD